MAPASTLPRRHRICFLVCLIGLLGMLATRVIHYASASLPRWLDDSLGLALAWEFTLFANVSALVMFYPIGLAVALVLLVVLRKRLFRREDGRWATRPLLHSLVWIAFFLNQHLFDIDPYLAWGAIASLALASLGLRRRIEAGGSISRYAAPAGIWLAFHALWLLCVVGSSGAVAIVVWAIAVPLVLMMGAGILVFRDRFWIAVVCIPAIQLLAAFLPMMSLPAGARWLGPGMAYSFCEAPRQDRLFAVLPNCFTFPILFSWEDCREGHVAEFSLTEPRDPALHHFFSERFYGRMEQLICMKDTVHVGMSSAILDGEDLGQSAMEFAIDDPRRFEANVAGEGMGDRAVHDPRRDAVYYVGEWSNRIVRRDRETGGLEEHTGNLPRRAAFILGTRLEGSLILSQYALHPARDSIFLAEWIGGHYVHELDLSTMQVATSYRHNNGGALGVTVDPDLDRIYVTGLWGVEVFDLRSRKLLFRKRLGFFNRVPVLDWQHGLVYVPSTVEGKIHVFDRTSFDRRGAIAVGYGTRHPHLSPLTNRFFASSRLAYFYWDAAELARRFTAN